MKEIIFLVEETTEGAYSAQALGEDIFTQADSVKRLKEMIENAVICHFDRPQELIIKVIF